MDDQPKRKAGRPPYEPTVKDRMQVESMVGFGLTQAQICGVMRIDLKTLRKYYSDELVNGEAKAIAQVAQSLFKKATGDGSQSVTAAIFWLKTRARWKDTTAHEISGPNGGPVQTIDLTGATDEQLNALRSFFAPLAGSSGDDDADDTSGGSATGG